MKTNDTIVSVSTPRGVGGIAVVRLSGPDALSIATKHLTINGNRLTLAPRQATYCHFDDLDDIVALYFPHGYTGEPTVELSCHGSLYIQQALLQVLVDEGGRLAEPGEFTRRAFLNGRLNLSQAEAVADLIDSVTPLQHRLAISQLRGGYAQTLKKLRRQLLDLTSLLELELDFSQEDVEFADRSELRQILSTLHFQLSALIASFRMGNALKRGIPVAIIGCPNAGKSSLLNALLGDDRAIVSDIPGTTRDTIEETLTLDGITFRFIDTAGLRHSDDTVEALGIQRTRKAVADAHLVLLVHDATTPWQEPDIDLAGKHVIVALNKIDLAHVPCQSIMPGSAGDTPCDRNGANVSKYQHFIEISAKTGVGLPALRDAMISSVRAELPHEDDVLITNVRHCEALQRVSQALDNVSRGLDAGTPSDLLTVDLRDALYHLGTVTGEVTSEEILSNIFGRFCIGK